MEKKFYTVYRHVYGYPTYMDIPLYSEEDCFLFDTREAAYKCIELIFHSGDFFHDERYGKVRYYADEY